MLFRLCLFLLFACISACAHLPPPSTPPAIPQAALPAPATPSPVTAPATRIALLLPLSSSSRELGKSLLDAAQMALFNANNPEIELLPIDTENVSLPNVMQIIQERRPSIILGPVFSRTTAAISPFAKSHGLTLISFSNDRTLAGNGIYLLSFMPEDHIQRVVTYSLQQGFTDFYALVPSNNYGTTALQSLRETVVSGGGTLAKSELYPEQEIDLSLNIKSISDAIRANPSPKKALFLAEGGQRLKTLMEGLSRENISSKDVQLLGTGQWDDPQTLTISTLQGSWFASTASEERKIFEQNFSQYYGYSPLRLSSLSYDAVALVAALHTGNHAFSPSALANEGGFNGIDGIFRFRPSGISERALSILQVNHDGFTVIEPAPKGFVQ